MKKKVKKLELAKETLRSLEAEKLDEVFGGITHQPPTTESGSPICP
jgi:hypothetical protein